MKFQLCRTLAVGGRKTEPRRGGGGSPTSIHLNLQLLFTSFCCHSEFRTADGQTNCILLRLASLKCYQQHYYDNNLISHFSRRMHLYALALFVNVLASTDVLFWIMEEDITASTDVVAYITDIDGNIGIIMNIKDIDVR